MNLPDLICEECMKTGTRRAMSLCLIEKHVRVNHEKRKTTRTPSIYKIDNAHKFLIEEGYLQHELDGKNE